MQKGHPIVGGNGLLGSHQMILCLQKQPEINITIHMSDDGSLETGGSIWHAGLAAAKYLFDHPDLVKGRRVLEIGAGCGLLGITAAMLGAKEVYLTDIEQQQELLAHNIAQNNHLWTSSTAADFSPIVRHGVYYFGSDLSSIHHRNIGDGDAEIDNYFDVLLAADVGYDLELHEPLATTFRQFLTLPSIDTNNHVNSVVLVHNDMVNDRIALLVEEVRWKDIYEWYIDGMKAVVNHECSDALDAHDSNDDAIDNRSAVVPCFSQHVQVTQSNITRLGDTRNESVAGTSLIDSALRLHLRGCGCFPLEQDIEQSAADSATQSPIQLTMIHRSG